MKVGKVKKIIFNCEAVTPIFNAGVETKEFELRASSLKGIIRYWWRAAKAYSDIIKLSQEEANIFGGTGKGEGRSKVTLKVYGYSNRNVVVDGNICENCSGISYLLYSVILSNRRRFCLKPGTKFKIEMISRDIDALNEFVKGLLIAQYFGGIGARVRRGAGSFTVTNIEGDTLNVKYLELFDTSDITNMEDVYELYRKISLNISRANSSDYSVISGSDLYAFTPQDNWIDALESIAKPFKEYRSKNKGKIYDMVQKILPIGW